MLEKYLRELQNTLNQGDAREESYYKHLNDLIIDFSGNYLEKKPLVTILPKNTEAGNPDFRIWDGRFHITGYIEAKDPSVTNLDLVENSEQLARYRNTFPNLILTNFYEFRLYRNGEFIKGATIGRYSVASMLKTVPPAEKERDFIDLFSAFFSFSLPQIFNARQLATELAKRTRFLKDEVIGIELANEGEKGTKSILGFYEAFKKYLIGTLTENSFADLYAQTITYGLFAARTRSEDSFNRELAFKFIPNTIGILKDIFRFISLEDPPLQLKVIVDDISEILNVTDVKEILRQFYNEGKGEDPVIHFYETFLTAYDPSIREKRGVYYTPQPVVGFIVRSVHEILKTHFGISDGLADEKVTVLDPAGGTLTFPAEAIKLAINEFVGKYGAGGKSKLIKNQILNNFFAFELMVAPYAIGHLKMSFLLEEHGYSLNDEERFQLYLTNALEPEDIEQVRIPGLSSLSEESHLAGSVKKKQPILIVLGNPPYSGHSANASHFRKLIPAQDRYVTDYFWNEKESRVDRKYSNRVRQPVEKDQKTFIGDLLMDYFFVDGKPLEEKNPKWLNDDYVKFLRFAQWKIERTGEGIVGMITNHSYLDNPTFRGMRQSLMSTYNEIHIIDLHGNSLKKEVPPGGGKDENVFDIRQGTAIALFIKQKGKKGCRIFHQDLFGARDFKYNWLNGNQYQAGSELLKPGPPFYFFTRHDTENIRDYLNWKAVNEIFPVNSVGIATARDHLTIRFTEQEMWTTVLNFSKMDSEIARSAWKLGADSNDWKVSLAQADLKQSGPLRDSIKPVLYRPFDTRHTYYTGKASGFHNRPRYEVMRNILEIKNLALAVSKRVEGNRKWEHAFVTDKIATLHSVSVKEGNYFFPLYLSARKTPKKINLQSFILFEPETDYETTLRIPNIDRKIYETLKKCYPESPSPEDILHYVYAVLYSTVYREKYGAFLKTDFPGIPFPKSFDKFQNMSKFGSQLVEMHLVSKNQADNPISKYQGESSNDRIEMVQYDRENESIRINPDKYFDHVKPDVWQYHIGGYQVLQKYLKDRLERNMDDPRYFCRVITSIDKTIRLQEQIDVIFPEVEKSVIVF